MKKRMMIAMGLAVLLMQNVLLSQEAASDGETETEIVRIVTPKHYFPEDLARLLEALADGEGTHVLVDGATGRLIIQASQRNMETILGLIAQLDVPTVSGPTTQFLSCRMYMLEVPVKGSDLKPFALVLGMATPPSSLQMLDALKGDDLRIGRLFATDDEPDERIVIQGRAASHETIKRIAQAIPESTIEELAWDDEAVPADIPAAQIGQLPESLQQHIRKFLGNEVRTVGYWFGNVSYPGQVAACMGPWNLEMETRPTQSADLHVQVRVTQEPPVSRASPTSVLDNSLQGRIGRPIIIGYNRNAYGARTMGALVILLEADAPGAGDTQTRTL
jgi:hypothetical protein